MFYKKSTTIYIIALVLTCASFVLVNPNNFLSAATIEELQKQIDARNKNIQDLEKEIAHYQNQVQETSKQANTLSNTIKTLDVSKQKLLTNMQVTENRIDKTNLEIEQLGIDIFRKENSIDKNKRVISETLRKMNEREETSLVTSLLAYSNLSNFWDEIDSLNRFQSSIKVKIAELEDNKRELVTSKSQTEENKLKLIALRKELDDQKKAVEQATKEKAELLMITKNQEATYKSILAEKTAKKAQLEKEIFEFESQLKIAIDPTSIPPSGKGVISWPLESVYVTQYFGNTEFATQNPQIYNGSGHSGIDLRAAIGTKVLAAKEGIVTATGNTDDVPGCYSYGKWVFVKHPNGLSTLYAHLSVISVTAGQTLADGQIVGYSGNTGYSTGPHLHFGVYATQGVKITKFENSINCKGATIPLADPKAYLNPLSYL